MARPGCGISGTVRQIGPDLVHGAAIRCLAISPDSRLAVTAGDDGRARIWELATRQPVGTLEHPAPVLDMAFTSTGASLLTGCQDGKARLWDIGNRRLLREFAVGSPSKRSPRLPTDEPWRPAARVARSSSGTPQAVNSSTRSPKDSRDGCSTWPTILAARPSRSAWATGPRRLRDVAYPVEEGIDELVLTNQVISNARLDYKGNLVRLDYPAWSEARRALTELKRRSQKPVERNEFSDRIDAARFGLEMLSNLIQAISLLVRSPGVRGWPFLDPRLTTLRAFPRV